MKNDEKRVVENKILINLVFKKKSKNNIRKMNNTWRIYPLVIAYFAFTLYVEDVMSKIQYGGNDAHKGISL